MRFRFLYIIIFLVTLSGCNKAAESLIVDASNINLKLDNGVLFLKEMSFEGVLVTYYPTSELKSEIQYLNGKKNGYERQWDDNGEQLIERFYKNGYKTGIHKAWLSSGQLKFEYYFNDRGEFHGSVKEWYKNGQIFRDFNYIEGKEVGSQRLWKDDGTIKANYEVVNGERFGLIGLKKCYTITVNEDEIK